MIKICYEYELCEVLWSYPKTYHTPSKEPTPTNSPTAAADSTSLPELISVGVAPIWLPAAINDAKTLYTLIKLTCYEYEVDGVAWS
jgi:hypothetical protein